MKIRDTRKYIRVSLYYAEIEGKQVLDEDSIREEFETKLKGGI